MSGRVKGRNRMDVVRRVFGTLGLRRRRRRAIRGLLGGAVTMMLCLSMVVQPMCANSL